MYKLSIIFTLIFTYGFSQNDSLVIEDIFAIEVCRQNEFNSCSNFSPSTLTRTPQLYKITKDGKINYDVIYLIPSPTIEVDNMEQVSLLYSAVFDQEPPTDSIDVLLPKRQVKRINNFLTKERKKIDYPIQYQFDGRITYNLYRIKFKCVYGGKKSTTIVSHFDKKLLIEKEVNAYFITDVYSVEPFK